MKKALLAVLIVASVVGISMSMSASEAEAFSCIRCLGGGFAPSATNSAWGMGATCSEARADAIANAVATIPSSCDQCGQVTPILVKDCYGSNPVKADYRVFYRCQQNICQ